MMKRNGFTLIELLVVMGIVALLAGLVSFNFNSARARARDVQRKNDLKALQQALEIYKNDNSQKFPAVSTWTDLKSALYPSYTPKWPSDPKESLKSGSWTEYSYTNPTALTYTLTACLENKSDPDSSGVACGSGMKFTINQP